MSSMANAIRRMAAEQDAGLGQNRFGTVQSVDPVRHMAKVLLQPEEVLTGWLPIVTTAAGAGWGMTAALTAGQQVFVAADSGDGQHGVILGAVHSSAAMPGKAFSTTTENGNGTPAQPGEFLLRHASGSCLRLCADGTVYIQGDVNIRGNLHVEGNVSDLIGTLDGLRQHYNLHKHMAPNGQTGLPVAQDP